MIYLSARRALIYLYQALQPFSTLGYLSQCHWGIRSFNIPVKEYRNTPGNSLHEILLEVLKAGFDDHRIRKILDSSDKVHLYVYEQNDS